MSDQGERMRENGLERLGVVAGGTLLVIAILVPWLDLSTSFPGQHLHELSPWTGILSGDALVVFGAVYLFLLVGMLYHVALVLRSPERHQRLLSVAWVTLFGIGALALIGFTLIVLPFGLEFGYPYYDVAIDIGGWVAGAGAICLMSSAVVAAMNCRKLPSPS